MGRWIKSERNWSFVFWLIRRVDGLNKIRTDIQITIDQIDGWEDGLDLRETDNLYINWLDQWVEGPNQRETENYHIFVVHLYSLVDWLDLRETDNLYTNWLNQYQLLL